MLPACGVWPMLEYELDIIQRKLDAGNEVVVLACEGDVPFCPANLELKPRICIECRSRTRAGIAWLTNTQRLTVGSLYGLTPAQKAVTDNWVAQLKIVGDSPVIADLPVELASLDWHAAALSTLQTTLKQFSPDINAHFRLIKSIVVDFFQSYLAFHSNLERHKPDQVWLFNGRISRFRPALRVSQRSNIKVFVYEYPYQGFKRYLVFPDQYPHDFGFRSKTWKRRFDESPLALSKRLAIGDAWYQKRLARIQTNHEKVFAVWQTEGLLPGNWNSSIYNVAVFNSSEWETAGVPESRRWNYQDQFSAIERIALDTQDIPNLHFTFRIHPHLAKKDKASAQHFLGLRKYSNITVLSPESPYDTYTLAMASDFVLTFYSLVGVESAWLGKQVICIGPSAYQDFGCAYIPQTHEELIDFFTHSKEDESRFPPVEMRKRGAQEFAFARLFSGTKPKYVEKHHISRANMRRGAVRTKIRAGMAIRAINRITSLPVYLVDAVRRIVGDRFLRKEIAQHPLRAVRRFLKDRIFGLTP